MQHRMRALISYECMLSMLSMVSRWKIKTDRMGLSANLLFVISTEFRKHDHGLEGEAVILVYEFSAQYLFPTCENDL